MSAKKLIPTVGFYKKKEDGQITSFDTVVNIVKDDVITNTQDTGQLSVDTIVKDGAKISVEKTIENTNKESSLENDKSSILSMSLCSTLGSELNNELPTINDNIQDNSQSNDQVNIKGSVNQEVNPDTSKDVENSVMVNIEKTNQVTINSSLQDVNHSSEVVKELNQPHDVINNDGQVIELDNELNRSQSSMLSSTLESNNVLIQDTNLSIIKDNIKNTVVNTEQPISKLTYQIPSKSEPFSKRLVANVTPSQKIFVQEMSKKFENESAFVRFMISRFMEDIDFKENE